MQWKKVLGAAAVFGALISNPLTAQQNAAFSIVIFGGASDTLSPSSSWAAERARMMQTAEQDLRTLQFDEARPRNASHTLNLGGLIFQMFRSPAVVFTVEQEKHNCPKAARQS